LADYQSVLRSVQYQNTNTDNPSNVQREICFTLNDGTDDSNTQSRQINIMDVIADAVCIPFAESFETDGEGITYVSNTFDDSPSPNFFFRTNTQPAGHAEAVTGIDASYFWACEDVMGGSNGATPGIIEFAPMIITGNNSFTFQVELGTSNSTGTRWEQTDNILIQYNIDGGEWNTFGLFQGDNPFGGDLRVDTDNDTITAGPYEATVPNGSVSDFLFAFNGTGDELKVRMVFVLQGGSEELVFDNIRLSGDVPVVASCKNISVYLDETGYVSIHPEDVMAGSPDDCGIDSVAVTPWEFTCDSAGENTVLLTVYDNVGNTSTCEATVTVLDTVKPEVICQDITVYLDTDGEASFVPSDIDGGSTDACSIYDLTASDTLFYCSDIGTTQVLLTVEDRSGNSSVCSALVTISDTVSLVIDCPLNQTETIDENCRFEIPDYRPLAGVTNSCGIDTVYQTPVPGTFVGVGDTTITLTARAGSKNASCSFNLNVTGVTANFTSDVTSGCTMTEISFSDLSVDAAKWWWDFGDGSPVDTTQNPTHVYIQPGTYTVSLKVNNLNGCSDSISELSYITINPPLANFSATPVTACTVPHTVFFTDQSVLPDTWNWDFGDGNTSTAQNPIHTYTTLGTFEVILLVTDTLTGCTDTAKTIIEINDNVPPVINCPSDTFVFANADCQGELDDYTSLATVYDDCATTPLVTQFPSPGTFFNDSIQVTLIAADNQDNKDSCVFTVTVTDTTSPSANCMNIQVFLNENGEAFLTPTDIDGGSTDNCGIDTLFSDITNFSSADLGENMVTLTVTDKSGNSSWCQSIVTP
jgi:PKD repeat protein